MARAELGEGRAEEARVGGAQRRNESGEGQNRAEGSVMGQSGVKIGRARVAMMCKTSHGANNSWENWERRGFLEDPGPDLARDKNLKNKFEYWTIGGINSGLL